MPGLTKLFTSHTCANSIEPEEHVLTQYSIAGLHVTHGDKKGQ